MKLILASCITALALTACAANSVQPQSTQQTPAAIPDIPATTQTYQANYQCQNGSSIKARYFGGRVELSLDTANQSTTLNQAVSGSGSRYVSNNGFYNKTTEWHVKGSEAYFAFNDPYGNSVETSCQEK